MQGVMAAARTGCEHLEEEKPNSARSGLAKSSRGRLRDDQERLARIITSEMGKTLTEARGEVGKAAEFFEYYAALRRATLWRAAA